MIRTPPPELRVAPAGQQLIRNTVVAQHVREDAPRRHGVHVGVAQYQHGTLFGSAVATRVVVVATILQDLRVAQVPLFQVEVHDDDVIDR